VSSILLARYAIKRDVTDRGFVWLVSWDLMSQITWSSEMGFMKTGSDIKNMIYIGELSMMYLGLVYLFSFFFSSGFASPLNSCTGWPNPMDCKAP